MGISKFGAGKLGMSLACTVMALGFAGVAQADFVKTVTTEDECTAQGGDVMDLGGEKHCFVPIISEEFQSIEYAGELKGVTECEEKNVRKSQIGDFCLIKLEAISAPAAIEVPEITETLTDIAKDEAEKEAKKKAVNALKKLF